VSSRIFKIILLFVCIAGCYGCASSLQNDRTPMKQPRIIEEDIRDGKQPQSGIHEPNQAQSSVNGPAAPPVEGFPPGTEPGNRPPRRFIWRDHKSSDRKWEPAIDEGSGRNR